MAKYGTSGSLVWAKSISGNGSLVEGNSIAASSLGHSYITGSFATSITFASGETNETTLNSLGGFQGGDIFVAKYDPDGGFAWARQAGGGSTGGLFEAGMGISVDPMGRAYVTGIFSGTSTFGPGEASQTLLTSSSLSDWDIFLASYLNDSTSTPMVDLDISGFRVTNRVSLARVRPVEILLVVRNNGIVNGSAIATVVGVQGGSEIYRESLQVSDNVGGGHTTFEFRTFVPTAAGDITWTATIADQDADVDQATAVSTIVP